MPSSAQAERGCKRQEGAALPLSSWNMTHPVVYGAERSTEADRSRVGGARSQCWRSEDAEDGQGEDELGHGLESGSLLAGREESGL